MDRWLVKFALDYTRPQARECTWRKYQVNASQEMRENSGWEMPSFNEVMSSLERMPQPPSVENLTYMLQMCRKVKKLAYTKCLYAYMCKSGLEDHGCLGNYLVPMLVQVGSICDAQQVFNRVIEPNVYSWNSLIVGYLECGELHHALSLYQKMQEDCVHPSKFTFVALLKVCARLKDAGRGREIHVEISRKGLERDIFVGSTLIDLYAKCGLLVEAQEAFNKLPNRDVVLWNVLMAGYAKHELGEEALNCFKQMQLEGVSPNAVSFVCSLKACGSVCDIAKGQEIHVEIARKGLERNLFVGSTLVDVYAKWGLLAKAQEVFGRLPVRDEVSWNALISGYEEHGLSEEALDCFEQMQLESISPDALTLVCSLRACSRLGALDKGREIHTEIARKGFERDIFVLSTLVDMYAKCGSLAEAREAFDKLSVGDVVLWTALIAGLVEHGFGEEALKCFEQMKLKGVSPDARTFVCSLKACGNIGNAKKSREIHAEIARRGWERDSFVGNTLVDMYVKCSLLANAWDVFDRLQDRDVVSWNIILAGYAEHDLGEKALICFEQMKQEGISPDALTFVCSLKACGSIGATNKGQEIHAEIARKGLERYLVVGATLVDMYAKCGSLVKALEAFDKLQFRNEISWNILIAGYVEHGFGEEALNYFEQMQQEGIFPDALTFVCSLKACGNVGTVDKGQEIHAKIAREGLENDIVVGNTLVDMYAKCGSLAKAQEVFNKLPVRDVVSWNALIAGYAQLGESQCVFHILETMRGEGIEPDGVTFLSILNACSHTGLVDKGQKYFESINKDYGIIPTIEHHTCMVDLLGRAGQLDEAMTMVKKIPFHPTGVMWHTVLGACRKWGNVELGRQAFKQVVQLEENNAAAYVFMYNIYADAHMEGEGVVTQ